MTKKIKAKDLKGNYKLKVKRRSLPACVQCLPIAPMDGHPTYRGVLIHSRIDCPPDTIYMVNDDMLDIK